MTLFDFTHVEDNKSLNKDASIVMVDKPKDCVISVYLASEQGFVNYCEGCQKLVAVQETGDRMFVLRIFCALKKCEKP